MAACAAAVNPILMLQAHKIVAIEVEKIRGAHVGGKVFLLQLQSHLFWILITRFWIIDRNRKQASHTEFCFNRSAQVGCKSGDAALARQVVPNKCNTGRQREFARLHCGAQLRLRIGTYCRPIEMHDLRTCHNALFSDSIPARSQGNNNHSENKSHSAD